VKTMTKNTVNCVELKIKLLILFYTSPIMQEKQSFFAHARERACCPKALHPPDAVSSASNGRIGNSSPNPRRNDTR